MRDLVEVGIALVRDAAAQGGRRRKAELQRRGAGARRPGRRRGRGGRRAKPSARKLRAGELDDKEIEVEVADSGGADPSARHPRHAGRSVGMINLAEMLGKAFGPRTKPKRMTVKASHAVADRRGSRQAARPGAGRPGGDRRRPRTTASSSSTRSTRSARASEAAAAPMSAARACSAICCR